MRRVIPVEFTLHLCLWPPLLVGIRRHQSAVGYLAVTVLSRGYVHLLRCLTLQICLISLVMVRQLSTQL